MYTKLSLTWFAVIFLMLTLSFSLHAEEEKESTQKESTAVTATAELVACGTVETLGSAQLSERPSTQGVKTIDVTVSIDNGLEPGKHGVHIHETGACEPCSAAGGHFDPGPMGDSRPDANHPFHAGELPNIEITDEGSGELITTTTRITLSDGPLSIFDADGSALIVHVNEDTFCPNGEEPGCAGGGRAACGIISAQ